MVVINMITEDIAELIAELHKTKSAAEVAKIFNKERKWVFSIINGCTFRLDYGFIAGLSQLGLELKLVKKGE